MVRPHQKILRCVQFYLLEWRWISSSLNSRGH